MSSDSGQDPNIGRGDANEMQRAIRARALHTVQRRPPKFWYTSPPRLIAAAVLAAVLLTVIGFGVNQCLRAFHLLISIYASQPQSAPPPNTPEPNVTQEGIIYVQPDQAIVSPPAAASNKPDSK